jgi:hypothetical protein
MAYEADRREDEIHMYLGTLEYPEDFAANFHVFHSERLTWLNIQDDTRKFDELPDGR